MSVGTVQEAMTAIVGVGSSISQQSNFNGEIKSTLEEQIIALEGQKTKLEEQITASNSIKLDIDANMHTVEGVVSYFNDLSGVLATNGMSTDDEGAIIS